MLNIVTSLPSGCKLINTVDEEFLARYDYYADLCNNSQVIRKLLLNIEGVVDIKGKYINAKFGETDLKSISTGSKAAIISIDDPKKICKAYNFGGNVLRYLTTDKEYSIMALANKKLSCINKDDTLVVNGVVCKGYKDINAKIRGE